MELGWPWLLWTSSTFMGVHLQIFWMLVVESMKLRWSKLLTFSPQVSFWSISVCPFIITCFKEQNFQKKIYCISDPNVKAILVNVFGGIVNCATIATGVVNATRASGLKLPLIVRLEGTCIAFISLSNYWTIVEMEIVIWNNLVL